MPFNNPDRIICGGCGEYVLKQLFVSGRWCPLLTSNADFVEIESDCKCCFCIDCMEKFNENEDYDCPTCGGDIFELVDLPNM